MNHKAKEEKVVKKGRKTTKKLAKNPKRAIVAALVIATMAIIATGAVISRQSAAVKTGSGTQPNAPAAAAASKNYTTVRVAGRDLQVDSQTGRLKPLTQEEAQKLAEGLGQMINQSTEGVVRVQHPDGSTSVDLQGRFQNVAVARTNDDGTVTEGCVDNAQSAGEFFGIDPQLIDKQATPASRQGQKLPNVPASKE